MSRVGKLPIKLPNEVKVDISGSSVSVSGPKGLLTQVFAGDISFELAEGVLKVLPLNTLKHTKSMWGTARSILSNMVFGVSNGFVVELEVNGVGYRASVKGSYLNLTLGKSHNTKILIPDVIKVATPKQNIIVLSGVDKAVLNQFASVIIKQRPPEPYKGKGIKRVGQYVQRKEGKKG